MAAEEAEGSREQIREATHVNTHRCLGQSEGNTPHDHTEGREWRAAEKERKQNPTGPDKAGDKRQRAEIATDNTRGQQHMFKPCHKNKTDV